MPTNTISGARAVFTIDGNPAAYAGGVNGGEDIQYEPVEVIGVLRVKEWVPVAYRTNLSANMFRTVGDPQQGHGSLKSLGFFPTENNILLLEAYNSVLLIDPVAEVVLAQVEGVKTASYNFSVSARGVVGQDVSFVCLGMQDELEVPVIPT